MNETVIFAIFVACLLSAGVAAAMIALAVWVGPRKTSPVKDEPFECGNPTTDAPTGHFPVHFYRVAILFVLFDLEIVFFYPWAGGFRHFVREAGWFGFWEMLVFAGLLVIGYVYLWAKGMLSWD